MVLKIRRTIKICHQVRVLYMMLRCMKVWEILIMWNWKLLRVYVGPTWLECSRLVGMIFPRGNLGIPAKIMRIGLGKSINFFLKICKSCTLSLIMILTIAKGTYKIFRRGIKCLG